MEQESKSSGSGVMKVLGIGCLVVILVPGIIGFLAWQKYQAVGGLDGLIQAGGGKAIEIVVNEVAAEMLEGMKIPEADRAAILAPIKNLGEKIAKGDIKIDQIDNFSKTLAEGPVLGVLMAEGFAHSYLQDSGLNGEEMSRALLTINRFQQGFVNETIEIEQLAALKEYVLQEVSSDNYHLKNSLSDDDLKSSLALMKKAADQASIPMTSSPIDIAGMLQSTIDAALEAAGAANP